MNSELVSRVSFLLTETFTQTNKEARDQAESELTHLQSTSPQDYFEALKGIILSQEIDFQVKKSAGTRVRELLKHLKQEQKLDLQSRLYLSQQVQQLFYIADDNYSLRNIIGPGLTVILTIDKIDQTGQCIQQLTPLALSDLQGNQAQIMAGLRTIRSIFAALHSKVHLLDFIKLFINDLMNLCTRVLSRLRECFQTGNEQQAYEFASILYEWQVTMVHFLDHLESTSSKVLNELISITQLADVFSEVLGLPIGDEFCVISLSQNAIYSQINKCKAGVMKCLNIIIQFHLDNKRKYLEQERASKVMTVYGESLPDSLFLTQVTEVMPKLIQSLIFICSHDHSAELLKISDVTDFIVETQMLLQKLVPEARFNQFIQPYAMDLITHVVVQLLKLTEADIEMMQNEPEEFASLSMDVVEKQESETPRSTAAQLLEVICETIEGPILTIIQFFAQVVDLTLGGQELIILKQYSIFEPIVDKVALSTTSPEIKIELALTIFCILAHLINKRVDLRGYIEAVLKRHIELLPSITSNLVLNRLCMLLYFSGEYLFLDDDASYDSLISLLFKCLDAGQVMYATHIQACDTLCYMAQDGDIMQRIEPFLPRILPSLISSIPNQHEKAFFDALSEIVKNFQDLIQPRYLELIEALKLKIQNESKAQGKEAQDSIQIVKSWHIIKLLAESSSMDPERAFILEQAISTLFHLLDEDGLVNFHEDLMQTEIAILKATKQVTNYTWTLFERIPVIQNRTKGDSFNLLMLINYFLIYGGQIIGQNANYIEIVLNAGTNSLFAEPKQQKVEAVNSQGALIYQLVLEYMVGMIDNSINGILSNVIQRYYKGFTNEFFKARLLSVILSAIIYNPVLTLPILFNQNLDNQTMLQFVLYDVLNNYSIFTNAYDKKIVVVGLTNVIVHSQLSREIQDMLVDIFQGIILVLFQMQEDNPSPALQPSSSAPMTSLINKILSNDSDDDGDIDAFIARQLLSLQQQNIRIGNEDSEVKFLISKIISRSDNDDEFDIFRGLMQNLHSNAPQLLGPLVGKLSPEIKEKFTRVMQFRRIPINNQNTVARRVVKVKRRRAAYDQLTNS